MKLIFFILLYAAATITSCAQTNTAPVKIPVGDARKTSGKEAVAQFAQGCFWHTEIVFQSLEGVRDAVSGYAGGKTINPDYESVSGGSTGHAESVQVFYDPSIISYETLVKAFFASQDPTTLNRQGNDVGTEYRSIAFYGNDNEKSIIKAEIDRLTASGKYKNRIVTEVVPTTKFFRAETYHQEYISHNPNTGYVRMVSIPDFLDFKREFRGKFKQ